MNDGRTAGDLSFEQYLRDVGVAVPDHEPEVRGTEKRPDYIVRIDGQDCVCEVKEFSRKAHPFPDPRSGRSQSMTDVLSPIRGQIREAARKLKEMRHLGLPLVVVLTNVQDAYVDLTYSNVAFAMEGDPTAVVPIARDGSDPGGDWEMVAGRDGRLARDHQYVSGVALLRGHSVLSDWHRSRGHLREGMTDRERMAAVIRDSESPDAPSGTYHSADLICARSPSAVPIPECFFAGPKDRRWDYADDALVQVAGPNDGE